MPVSTPFFFCTAIGYCLCVKSLSVKHCLLFIKMPGSSVMLKESRFFSGPTFSERLQALFVEMFVEIIVFDIDGKVVTILVAVAPNVFESVSLDMSVFKHHNFLHFLLLSSHDFHVLLVMYDVNKCLWGVCKTEHAFKA